MVTLARINIGGLRPEAFYRTPFFIELVKFWGRLKVQLKQIDVPSVFNVDNKETRTSEMYSELCQTSRMELITKIINV